MSGALFSQAQILHLMKAEFARARRHSQPLACVLLQVDRLAQLVDLYGPDLRVAARDALCQLVRAKTRGADLLGLVNEDRYLLMMPQTDLGQARIVAERLQQMFGDVEVSIGGRALALTMTIGITANGDQQAMFFDTLMAQAEAALEWAIERGGNQVASFGETMLLDGGAGPPEKK